MKSTKAELTSIVVPFHNKEYYQFHTTGNCLGNVRYFTTLPYELILIDNASPITNKFYKKYADKYVRLKENKGYGGGMNEGMKRSKGKYVCLLSNDVQVYEGWLEGLIEGLKTYDIVCAFPMYDDAYARGRESKERSSNEFLDKSDFSCVLFTRETMDKIGPFDEELKFGYSEDIDWKMRADKLGLKIGSTKKVQTHHIIGMTSYSLTREDYKDVKGVESLDDLMNRNRKYVEHKYNLKKEDKKEEKPVNKTDSYLVRTAQTGDRIYVVEENGRRWIKNPETLTKLGFKFGQEKKITYDELQKFEDKGEIDLKDYGFNTKEQKKEEINYTPFKKPVLGYRRTASPYDEI